MKMTFMVILKSARAKISIEILKCNNGCFLITLSYYFIFILNSEIFIKSSHKANLDMIVLMN